MKFISKKWLAMMGCSICVTGVVFAGSEPIGTNSITAPSLYNYDRNCHCDGQSPWADGIGNGFKNGTMEIDGTVAYAHGAKIFGSSRVHNLLFGSVNVGRMISGVVMENSPLRGNWEVLGDVFGGFQINTRHANLGGVNLMLRYNFITGTRLVPFAEGGGGVLFTDISHPDLGSRFEFNEKVGIGVHYFFAEHWSAIAKCQFMHISNAGLKSPNRGVNAFPFSIGVGYFF